MTDEQKALRESVARAMKDAHIHDDEGPMPRLFDLLGFSGENKANMVVNALADAAIAVALEKAADIVDRNAELCTGNIMLRDILAGNATAIRALIPHD